MELRKYFAGKDVGNRYAHEWEQWHNEESQIEILQRGLYSAYTDDSELSESEKKIRAKSKEVWTGNNTFMWQWDGINDKVKGLAKHRQPNLVTSGIAQQYHALLTPPLTASCGHRCVMARAELARETTGNINRLDRYYGTYYGPDTEHPEGLTSDNIDEIMKLVTRDTTHQDCCRCHNAKIWFGHSNRATSQSYREDSFHGLTTGLLTREQGLTESKTLRMHKGEWYALCNGPHYYSNVVEEHKRKGALNLEHLGWHAGLMRPRFRFREEAYEHGHSTDTYSKSRPTWFSNIRLADDTSVISGLHNPKRYLCPNCYTAAKGLPPHLYWVARGYSLKEARARQEREYTVLQGRGKRWLQSTVMDIKNWEKLGQLYA